MKVSNYQMNVDHAKAKRSTRDARVEWHKRMDKKFKNDSATRKKQVCPIPDWK